MKQRRLVMTTGWSTILKIHVPHRQSEKIKSRIWLHLS
jgi:hypothetical protein